MFNDIVTVIWKEWKEVVGRSTQSRGDSFKLATVVILILGLIVWRASMFVLNPASGAIPSFVMVQFLIAIMADSFAGERERHTLETLLASRLSDLSILIGKIAAGVLMAFGLIVFTFLMGIAGAYVNGSGNLIRFSWTETTALLLIYLLAFSTVSCAAVLFSLRARTVRAAIQTLTWSFVALFFLTVMGFSWLPLDWRNAVLRLFADQNLVRTEFTVIVILASLTSILFSAARLRFRRARLILD